MSLDYVFQTETRIYFLMKYIEGGDLFRHLAKKGKFKEKVARFSAAQVMVALGYLHKKRIIYRDLKL
jgi:serum/glucocorticoid-regulated kinase 2